MIDCLISDICGSVLHRSKGYIILELKRGFRISLQCDEIYDQLLFHCKNSIIIEMRIDSVEDLGCHRLVAITHDLQMWVSVINQGNQQYCSQSDVYALAS